MKCTRFEEYLFERPEIDASVKRRMDEHAAHCSRCRELALLVTGDERDSAGEVPAREAEAVAPPIDLIDGVLVRTSGGSCERVAGLLSERIDVATGEAAADVNLLQMHLEACPECAALSRALERLGQELPGLAELQPDDAFVADVMAATIGVAQPVVTVNAAWPQSAIRVPQPIAAWWASVAAFGERLASRPRLAFEGAFVATVMLFLIAGLPSTSLAELPARTFDQIGQGRAELESVALTKLGELAEIGRQSWSAAAERITASLPTNESASVESRRLGDRLRSWVTAGVELVDKLFSSFKETVTNMINTRRNT